MDLNHKKIEKLPFERLVFGQKMFGKFPTGCGSVFSRDVVQHLANNMNLDINYKKNDDYTIGINLRDSGYTIINYDFTWCTLDDLKNFENFIANNVSVHYRTKTNCTGGPMLFKKLLDYYY